MALSAEFDAAQATNAVGLDLYRQLAPANPAANLVLSPYSIESALALAYAGADGSTRREMASALRLPDDNAALEKGFAKLRGALGETATKSEAVAAQIRKYGGQRDSIQWSVGNRLFGQEGYPFRPAFLYQMKDRFAAPFEAMDFKQDTERSRTRINTWVEEQTRNRIKNLIPQGMLEPDSRLVLVNALYLKAPWETSFAPTSTRPLPFHAPSGTRPAPTMHRIGQMYAATENGLTLVSLDYVGDELCFLLILPDPGQSLHEAQAKLTSENLARWARRGILPATRVSLYLPKFRVEGESVRLGAALRALNMKDAFDDNLADFTRIAPPIDREKERLALAEVLHKTFIALDEEGTEAAAATAVLMRGAGAAAPPPPVEVRVDRPFLFAIQHRPTGACLFLGHITEPGR